MNRLWLGLGLLLGVIGIVGAQQISMPPPSGVVVTGCAYNLSLPTIATGFPGYVQCDNNGRLLVVTGSAPSITDPCQANAKSYNPINITTATNTRIAVGVTAKKIYVCHLSFKEGTGQNLAIVEGTGGTCAVGTVGVWGGATAAGGFIGATGDGLSVGSGVAAVWATATVTDDLCIITASAQVVSGHISYVTQ